MTFTEIHGNLFDRKLEENEFYVHCISADYACGAGIAKEFNKKYNLTPRLKELPRTHVMLIDDVFNLVTKGLCYLKPSYESLEICLSCLLEITSALRVKTLVMPRIGCGLDKLEWNKVKEMIKDIFKDTDIAIEVYYL